MKQFLSILILLPLFSIESVAATAFVNVNVVPMDTDTILMQQTVIVDNGLIVTIGNVDRVPVPKDAEVIDGTDRYLIPGLTEMHAHVPAAGSQNLDRDFSLFIANGVTTVRGMLGQPSHLGLRQGLQDGAVFGPRLVASGPSLNGDSVNGARDAADKVRAQHAAGYDFIKLHPGLSKAEFAAIAETANDLGMPFAGHVPAAVGVEGALAVGMASIDHLDGYFAALMPPESDGAGGYGGFFDVLLTDQASAAAVNALARETADSGTWNVPTQSLFENLIADVTIAALRNRPEMRYMPLATVNAWADAKQRQLDERGFSPALAAQAIQLRRQIILALHRAGAGLLLGSDAPQVFNVPGYSLHRELGFLVASGLSPFEALQSGTTSAAKFLGTNTGAVSVGRDADLLLLDANPLTDISNSGRIHGVMLRGTWLPATQLALRLAPYRR